MHMHMFRLMSLVIHVAWAGHRCTNSSLALACSAASIRLRALISSLTSGCTTTVEEERHGRRWPVPSTCVHGASPCGSGAAPSNAAEATGAAEASGTTMEAVEAVEGTELVEAAVSWPSGGPS